MCMQCREAARLIPKLDLRQRNLPTGQMQEKDARRSDADGMLARQEAEIARLQTRTLSTRCASNQERFFLLKS